MTEHIFPPRLSEEQKRQFCSMLMMGCDRETACNYLGFTIAQLRDEVRHEPDYVQQVLRAEAAAEFHQIRNLHEATKDSKQWRASVWWLERKIPERFARRAANAITAAEWQQFLELLAEMIVTEIASETDRQRVLARLSQIVAEVDAQLSSGPRNATEVPDLSNELDDESGEP